MGVDYYLNIRRREDGKRIGRIRANELKSIVAAPGSVSGKLAHDGLRDGTVFNSVQLQNVIEASRHKMGETFEIEREIRRDMLLAMSKLAMEKLTNELDLQFQFREDFMCAYESACMLYGKLKSVVEDSIAETDPNAVDWRDRFNPANNYNADGLERSSFFMPDAEFEVEISS